MIAPAVEVIPSGPKIRSASRSGTRVPVTSSRQAPTTFQPSFEYRNRSPGAVVGGFARRRCSVPGPVGASSVPTRSPAVWVIRWCRVMVPNGSASPSHGTRSFTETSSARRPAASSCRTISDANDFEMDPIWNRVVGRTGVRAATSASPRTTTPRASSRSVTDSASPGACEASRWCSAETPMRSKASSRPGIAPATRRRGPARARPRPGSPSRGRCSRRSRWRGRRGSSPAAPGPGRSDPSAPAST